MRYQNSHWTLIKFRIDKPFWKYKLRLRSQVTFPNCFFKIGNCLYFHVPADGPQILQRSKNDDIQRVISHLVTPQHSGRMLNNWIILRDYPRESLDASIECRGSWNPNTFVKHEHFMIETGTLTEPTKRSYWNPNTFVKHEHFIETGTLTETTKRSYWNPNTFVKREHFIETSTLRWGIGEISCTSANNIIGSWLSVVFSYFLAMVLWLLSERCKVLNGCKLSPFCMEWSVFLKVSSAEFEIVCRAVYTDFVIISCTPVTT